LQNTPARVFPKPCQSYRRLSNRFPQWYPWAPVGRRILQTWWGLRRSAPGLWCRVLSLPGAGGRRTSWPAKRVRVTRDRFGRRRRGSVWSFFLLHVAAGFLSNEQILARRRRRWCKIYGRRRAGSPPIGRPAGARQGRPMPTWTSGRWRTGLPRARGLLRPLVAGGGQGHSKMDGRPATARVALFFPGPPLVPPPCGCYAEAPLVR